MRHAEAIQKQHRDAQYHAVFTEATLRDRRFIEYPKATAYHILLLFFPAVTQELSGASFITTGPCSRIPLAAVSSFCAGIQTIPVGVIVFHISQ